MRKELPHSDDFNAADWRVRNIRSQIEQHGARSDEDADREAQLRSALEDAQSELSEQWEAHEKRVTDRG